MGTAAKYGFAIYRSSYRSPIDLNVIAGLLASREPERGLDIVQVGANDGVTNDPLHRAAMRYGRKIMLIEPQTALCAVIKENYDKFPGEVLVQNISISDQEGERPLYQIDEKFMTSYKIRTGYSPTGISSFDRRHVENHVSRNLGISPEMAGRHVVSNLVKTDNLPNILRENDFQQIDILQIDCEGHDWRILKTLAESNIRPLAINFEYRHLSEGDSSESRLWLQHEGYDIFLHGKDCLAVRIPHYARCAAMGAKIAANEHGEGSEP